MRQPSHVNARLVSTPLGLPAPVQPTGGYLLLASFSTGAAAAQDAREWLYFVRR